MIPIAKPSIGQEEINAVLEIMKSGQISQGKSVYEFEQKFAAEFNYPYAAAINNGTTALHVALLAAGVQPGDKVITTPFSFIATTNAIIHCGATPCFVDIEKDSFNLSPAKLKESLNRWPDAKYILLVHLYGQPCAMDEIMPIVEDNGLILIEDCAQAHGATFHDKPVGSFGLSGTFSFYPTKNMTTGEGGMIVANDPDYIHLCRKYINHGSTKKYVHEITGYNYRMTNMAAAIGLAQLDKIREMNRKRISNAKFLIEHIENSYVTMPQEHRLARHVYHQFTLRTKYRETLAAHLANYGIESAIHYPVPIHLQQNVREYLKQRQALPEPNSLEISELASKEVLSIPVHPLLSSSELIRIVECINSFHPEGDYA